MTFLSEFVLALLAFFYMRYGSALVMQRFTNKTRSPRNSSEMMLMARDDTYDDTYEACTCSAFSGIEEENSAPQRSRRHKTILVTVSFLKGSELKATLKCNKDHADRIIVLTENSDNETIKVCSEAGVECHPTSAFRQTSEDKFNKGRAIRWLQQELHADPANTGALILLVDSDICLPPNFWGQVPENPKAGYLYIAVNRCMFETPEDYERGWPAYQERHPLSTLGMFQMYVARPEAQIYSDEYQSASGSDVEFGRRFKKVITLPMFLLHLGISQRHSDWDGHVYESFDWSDSVPSSEARCPCCEPVPVPPPFIGEDEETDE